MKLGSSSKPIFIQNAKVLFVCNAFFGQVRGFFEARSACYVFVFLLVGQDWLKFCFCLIYWYILRLIKVRLWARQTMFHFSENINRPLCLTFIIISLLIMIPVFILHRKYFRIFRHLQLIYLYYMMETDGMKRDLSDTFSRYLSPSWLKW